MPGIDKTTFPIIAGMAIIGVLVMLSATPFGIGITPDSTVYLDAARNLADDRGLIVLATDGAMAPLIHYPPLYPALIALFTKAGVTVETVARWLNAILFGANIFLVGVTVARCVPDSYWLPLLATFLALSAPDVMSIHSFALSEPLYLFLTLAGVLWLNRYFEKRRPGYLIVSSILIGLSSLTRYAGAATILTGAVGLLIINREGTTPIGSPIRSIKNRNHLVRVIDAALFGAIACAPLGLWTIRNQFLATRMMDRQVLLHPVKLQQLVAALSTAAQWLLIGRVRTNIRMIAFVIEILVIIALLLYGLKKGEDFKPASSQLPKLLAIFAVCYVVFLVFTASFIDADTVFDSRSLLPVHVVAIVIVAWIAGTFYFSTQRRVIRLLLVVVALLFGVSYGVRSLRWLAQARVDGQGYASRAWRESPTIARIQTLSGDIRVYSNGFDAIYYLTGRRAHYLPERMDHVTGQPNQDFDLELRRMGDDLREHRGVLIYFNTLPERSFLPTEDELKSALKLSVKTRDSDGSVYEIRK